MPGPWPLEVDADGWCYYEAGGHRIHHWIDTRGRRWAQVQAGEDSQARARALLDAAGPSVPGVADQFVVDYYLRALGWT